MISTVEVAFADVSAASLRWALDLPPRPALAVLRLGGGALPVVELRLLGASHQVLVYDGDALCFSETVACDLVDGRALPGSTGPGRYEFGSDVRHLDGRAFAAAVDDLTARAAERDDVLLGRFPGAPHATTLLAADPVGPGPLGWRTWHAYPQTGQLVATRTRLVDPLKTPPRPWSETVE